MSNEISGQYSYNWSDLSGCVDVILNKEKLTLTFDDEDTYYFNLYTRTEKYLIFENDKIGNLTFNTERSEFSGVWIENSLVAPMYIY